MKFKIFGSGKQQEQKPTDIAALNNPGRKSVQNLTLSEMPAPIAEKIFGTGKREKPAKGIPTVEQVLNAKPWGQIRHEDTEAVELQL